MGRSKKHLKRLSNALTIVDVAQPQSSTIDTAQPQSSTIDIAEPQITDP